MIGLRLAVRLSLGFSAKQDALFAGIARMFVLSPIAGRANVEREFQRQNRRRL